MRGPLGETAGKNCRPPLTAILASRALSHVNTIEGPAWSPTASVNLDGSAVERGRIVYARHLATISDPARRYEVMRLTAKGCGQEALLVSLARLEHLGLISLAEAQAVCDETVGCRLGVRAGSKIEVSR